MSAARIPVAADAPSDSYMRLARALAQPVQPETQDAETLRRLQALAAAMGPRATVSLCATAHGSSWFAGKFGVILSDDATTYKNINGDTTDAALTAAEAWVAGRENVA